jgi:hypothetical protein
MRKILFATLVLAAACDVDARSAASVVEQGVSGDDPFCGAAMPAMTKWDGKPLPATQGAAAVFIVTDPQDAGRSWAIETDDAQVVAWVDLDAQDTGRLIDVIAAQGDPRAPVLKVPRPTPPRDLDATFYLALAANNRAALQAALDACSGLPTGK